MIFIYLFLEFTKVLVDQQEIVEPPSQEIVAEIIIIIN